jgi:hypothetical protein
VKAAEANSRAVIEELQHKSTKAVYVIFSQLGYPTYTSIWQQEAPLEEVLQKYRVETDQQDAVLEVRTSMVDDCGTLVNTHEHRIVPEG